MSAVFAQSFGERREDRAPLRYAGIGLDLEDAHHGVAPGSGARLAHGLGDPFPAALGRRAGQCRLILRRRSQLERPQRKGGGGAGKLTELRLERKAQAVAIGTRLSQSDLRAPPSATGQPCPEAQAPQHASRSSVGWPADGR